jgi:hypothetical protein
LPLVGEVVLSRSEVHPHIAVSDLHREDARLIGELVEGPAALEIEAGVVPVAGQDTVTYATAVQGKPHMGAAIVHGVHLAVVEEERNRVTGDPDRHPTGGAHIVYPSGPHEVS